MSCCLQSHSVCCGLEAEHGQPVARQASGLAQEVQLSEEHPAAVSTELYRMLVLHSTAVNDFRWVYDVT